MKRILFFLLALVGLLPAFALAHDYRHNNTLRVVAPVRQYYESDRLLLRATDGHYTHTAVQRVVTPVVEHQYIEVQQPVRELERDCDAQTVRAEVREEADCQEPVRAAIVQPNYRLNYAEPLRAYVTSRPTENVVLRTVARRSNNVVLRVEEDRRHRRDDNATVLRLEDNHSRSNNVVLRVENRRATLGERVDFLLRGR